MIRDREIPRTLGEKSVRGIFFNHRQTGNMRGLCPYVYGTI
nr:MAG TPA: hypothetical protein [Caudoviricetes sp.]